MTLTRLSAVDGEAILSLDEAKLQCRVTHDSEDSVIADKRDAAILYVERLSGVILAPADFRWTLRCFERRVDLPVRPVTALTSVDYYDDTGASAGYLNARLIENSVYPVFGESWPYANGYAAFTFTAGLSSPDEAGPLMAAVRLMLGHLFANREAVQISQSQAQEVPLGVSALIDTYRQVLV